MPATAFPSLKLPRRLRGVPSRLCVSPAGFVIPTGRSPLPKCPPPQRRLCCRRSPFPHHSFPYQAPGAAIPLSVRRICQDAHCGRTSQAERQAWCLTAFSGLGGAWALAGFGAPVGTRTASGESHIPASACRLRLTFARKCSLTCSPLIPCKPRGEGGPSPPQLVSCLPGCHD